MDAKLLLNRFNKLYGIISIYNGIRYLELSNSFNEVYCKTCNESFDRVSYLISEKSSITDNINHSWYNWYFWRNWFYWEKNIYSSNESDEE